MKNRMKLGTGKNNTWHTEPVNEYSYPVKTLGFYDYFVRVGMIGLVIGLVLMNIV
jgi:hypothetical protein